MKYIIGTVIVAFLCAVTGSAETINEVYFNPTRWGQYDNLKITEKLGAETIEVTGENNSGELNISTSGTARVTARGKTENDETEYYAITKVDNTHGGTIEMEGTTIKPTSMSFKGGKAIFEGTSADDSSSIGTLDTGDTLRVQVINGTLELPTLKITHNSDSAVETIDSNSIKGFKLGAYVIPVKPFMDTTYKSLIWQIRKATVATTEGHKEVKVKVLAAKTN